MTGFPSASVPVSNNSRLPTDYIGMADVSRGAIRARPCSRQKSAFGQGLESVYRLRALCKTPPVGHCPDI